MRAINVHAHQLYTARVSGRIVPVRVTCLFADGRIEARNLFTDRLIVFKTARRLRPTVPAHYLTDPRVSGVQAIAAGRLDAPA